jgi:hypothetical protein
MYLNVSRDTDGFRDMILNTGIRFAFSFSALFSDIVG